MAKIDRAALAHLMNQVAPGVGTRDNDLQQTSYVLNSGYVYTYNEEMCMSAPLPEGMADFHFAVLANEFQQLINKMREDHVDITWEKDCMVVKGKRAKAELCIDPEVKQPIEELKIPAKKKFIDLGGDFQEAVRRCLPIVGKDMLQPLSTCLHLKGNYVEAADNDKAARYVLKKSVFPTPVYLERRNALWIPRLPVKAYALSPGWIHFEMFENDVIMSCRVKYEGQAFSDITHLLDAKGKVLELPEEIPEILERAGVFCNSTDGTEVVMEDKYVRVRIADNWCTIRGEGAAGRYEEKVRIAYKDAPIHFSTDVRTLLDAVTLNQTCEVCPGLVKIFDKYFKYLVSTGKSDGITKQSELSTSPE